MKRESGNVLFALFGAVAFVGILSAGLMTFVKGPLTTSVKLTRQNVAESQMLIAGQVAVMAATSQPSEGDCDSDGFVEPLPWRAGGGLPIPVNGGLLPNEIGINKKDPWGTEYGYCSWDHGAVVNDAGCGGGAQLRLAGTNNASYPVVALISAGPDKIFTTTCNTFAAADVNSDGDLADATDLPLVRKAALTDDDVIMTYTYQEATGVSGGLWSLKSGDPGVATIDKNIELEGNDGDATFTGMVTTSRLNASGSEGVIDVLDGLRLADATTYNPACTGALAGSMRRNGSSMQMCDGTSWSAVGGGSTSMPTGSIAVVQTTAPIASVSSGTSVNTSFPANVTAGNHIIVTITSWSGTISNITDSEGNSYTLAVTNNYGATNTYIYYTVVTTSVPLTVEIDFTGGQLNFGALEVSGLASSSIVDATGTMGQNGGAGATVTASSPTTQADTLAVAVHDAAYDGNLNYASVSGWTMPYVQNDGTNYSSHSTVYQIQSAIGTITHEWSHSGPINGWTDNTGSIAVFKADLGGGQPMPSVNITSTLITNGGDDNSATTVSTNSFDSTGYEGIVVFAKHEGLPATITISDNKSSAFSYLTKQTHSNNDLHAQLVWAPLTNAGPGHIVTMTMSAARPWSDVAVWLINADGAAVALDTQSGDNGWGNTEDAGYLITTGRAALVMGVGGYTPQSFTPGAGWTENNELFDDLKQSMNVSSAGTYDPVATSTANSDWVAVSAAFRAVSVAGGGGGPSSAGVVIGDETTITSCDASNVGQLRYNTGSSSGGISFVGANEFEAALTGGPTNIVIPVPSGIQAGDLIMIAVSADDRNSTWTWPSGFTQIVRRDTTDLDGQSWGVGYKIAVGSETSVTMSMNGTWDVAGALAVYSGVDVTDPIDSHSDGLNTTATSTGPWTVSAPSVTTSRANSQIVWVGATDFMNGNNEDSFSFDPPVGFTERADIHGYWADDSSSWAAITLADRSVSSAGTMTGTVDGQMNNAISGNAITGAMMFVLNPEASSTPAPTTPFYRSMVSWQGSGAQIPMIIPDHLQNGDLMLWSVVIDNTGGTVTWPAGWTQIGSASSTVDGQKIQVAYKVANSEPTSGYYISTISGDEWASQLLVYGGVDTSSPIMASQFLGDSTSTASPWTTPAVSVTTTAADAMLVHFGGIDNLTSHGYSTMSGIPAMTQPAGFTHRASTYQREWISIIGSDKLQPVAGPSGSITSTATGTGNAGKLSALIALRASTSGTSVATTDTITLREMAVTNVDDALPISTVKAGDLILFTLTQDSGTAYVLPSGFAELANVYTATPDGQRWVMAYKVSNGTEHLLTFDGDGNLFAVAGVYEGVSTSSPIANFSESHASSATLSPWTIANPGVTPTLNGSRIVWYASGDISASTSSTSYAPPSGYIERFDQTYGWTSAGWAEMKLASASATGGITGTASDPTGGVQGLFGSIMVALTPANAAAGIGASSTGVQICNGTDWVLVAEGSGGGGATASDINNLEDGVADYTLHNVFLGQGAGESAIGTFNVGVGENALAAVTTGKNNIGIGYNAGNNITTGSNNVIIGSDIQAMSATGDAQLNIEDTIFGDLAANRLGFNVPSPLVGIHAGGEVLFGSTGLACSSVVTGAIRYVSASNRYEWCTGTAWRPFTPACRAYPSDFFFPDVHAALASSSIESTIRQISGIACASAEVSIRGEGTPQYRVCSNSDCSTVVQTWTDRTSNITSGQYLQVRLTSSGMSYGIRTATINVGGQSRPYKVVTADSGTHKVVFTISGNIEPNFGGVAGADAICMARASSAGLGGTFYAWLATTAADDPETRFTRATVPYRLVNGTLIANNWTDLVDGEIANPINLDENGASSTGQIATNVNPDGTVFNTSRDCNDWTVNGNNVNGHMAFGSDSTDGGWSDGSWSGTPNCGDDMYSLKIMCFQQ